MDPKNRNESEVEWNPLELIRSALVAGQVARTSHGCDCNYAIILLNQAVINEELFLSLWNEASFRMLVDGGGNHWRLLCRKFPDLVRFPEVLCGNFDSIRRGTLDLLKMHEDDIEIVKFGVQGQEPSSPSPATSPTSNSSVSFDLNMDTTKTTDTTDFHHPNYETDFTQALQILFEKIGKSDPGSCLNKTSKIIAFCETSGRFDQVMGNIDTLYKSMDLAVYPHNPCQIFLLSSTSITFLLPPGHHKIICGKRSHPFLKINYCSLIPIGCECVVTTQGLKQNFSKESLAFGINVCTSNEVVGIDMDKDHFVAKVENSEPILWSMELEFDNQLKNVW